MISVIFFTDNYIIRFIPTINLTWFRCSSIIDLTLHWFNFVIGLEYKYKK
jgi:hypothetical protein